MIKYFKYFLFIFLFSISLTGCLALELRETNITNDFNLTIGSQQFNVEVATSLEQQVQGLSNRQFLEPTAGMLFIYEDLVSPGFWMKNMNFSIDIIWIKDNKVVGWTVAQPVVAGEILPIYYPPEPINRVFEVNAGTVEKIDLKIGDTVEFSEQLDSILHIR
jgi:uncharacterized membrane protein (UPF0127 family)